MKKYVSLLLVLAMLMSMTPVSVFAEGETAQADAQVNAEVVEVTPQETEQKEPEEKEEEPEAEKEPAVASVEEETEVKEEQEEKTQEAEAQPVTEEQPEVKTEEKPAEETQNETQNEAQEEAQEEAQTPVETVPAQEETASEEKSDEDAADEGTTDEGAADEGTTDEGATDEGAADEGTTDEGAADEGTTDEGATDEGAADEGTTDEGAADEGTTDEGAADEGTTDEGATDEGATDESTTDEGAADEDAADEGTTDEGADDEGMLEEGVVEDPALMDAAMLEEGVVEAPQLLADAVSYPAVTALNVASSDDSSITVYWPAVNHDLLSGYRISYSKTDNFDNASRVTVDSGDTMYTLSNLDVGDTYYFWIQACYETESGTVYSSYRKMSGSVTIRPAEPGNLKATTKSTTSVQLTWTLPSNYSSLSGYIIERDGVELTRVSKTSKSYTDNTLVLGTTYLYRIYSFKTVNGTEILSECEYAELEYTALPPAPTIKTVESAGLNSIKLTWSAVGNVDGYNIYRTANPSSTPKLVGTVGADTTTFTDSASIITGQTYWYSVTAYAGSVESEKSAVSDASARPPVPQNPKAVYLSDTEIKVTWDTVADDVQGYVIYGSDDNQSYEEIAETGDITFTEEGLAVGQMRYYRVCSYVKILGERLESDFSKTVYDITRPLAPKELKLSNPAYDKITLDWSYSEGADGYEIWRSTDGTNFTKVKSITEGDTLTWTDTGKAVGTRYYYKVRAYVQESTYVGPYSETKYVTAKPATPDYAYAVPRENTNSITVYWAAVEGADGYYIYASEDGAASTLVATQSANSDPERYKTIKNLKPGSSYRFFVGAYKTVDGTNVMGARAEADKVLLEMYAPLELKSTATSLTTMEISWKAIGGIDGYAVRVTSADDLSYSYRTELKETSLTLDGLTSGYRYTVSVCAYRTINGQNVYGPEATNEDQVFFTAPDAPTKLKVASNIKQYGVNVTWTGVDNCDGYVIERSEAQFSGYEVVKTLEGADTCSYLDVVDPAYAGRTLYYRVRSYVNAAGVQGDYGQRAVSDYDDAYTVLTPPRPPKVTATAVGGGSVELVWDELENVDGYHIYYRRGTNSWSYKAIELGDVSYNEDGQLVYVLSGLTMGKKYDFKVRGYVQDEATTVVGALSPAASATPAPVPPTGLYAMAIGAKSVKLGWEASEGAGGYRVYMSTELEGTYTQVTKSYATSATVTGLTCGATYYFKVCAYKGDAKGVTCDPIKVTTAMGATSKFWSNCVDYDSLLLKWKAVPDANGYQIQIESKTTPNSWSTLIKNATGTSYTVDGLKVGQFRNYRIRAYANVDGKQVWGPWVYLYDAFSVAAKPTEVKVAYTGQNRVRLSWKYSKGAIGYMVYAVNQETGERIEEYYSCEDSGTLTYIVNGLESKTKYKFWLRAVSSDELGNQATSTMSATVTTTTK